MENSTCSIHFVFTTFHCKSHGNALVYQSKAVYVAVILSGHFVESNFRTFGIYITVVNRIKSIKPFPCSHYVVSLITSHVFISIDYGVDVISISDLVPLPLHYTAEFIIFVELISVIHNCYMHSKTVFTPVAPVQYINKAN
jgi:hypothetical protein